MTTFFTYTALGLVVGAIYAIAASGLVLTYNTSGIFNFAHGAQAMFGAFAYYQLDVAWGLPTWLSLVLVLGVLGPGIGWLLYVVVMRGLRDTEEVTRIVVTVAIMLGLVAIAQWMWNPVDSRIPPMLFGSRSLRLGGVSLRYHEVLCLVIAVALALTLRLLFTRTRLGVLMRATVDDPDLLQLTGHNPDAAARLAWMLGSTLAVLAGVLITPVIGGTLEANALTLLVVDAFAAAIFGRLRSIPLTFLGAIVIGLAGTWLVGYAPTTWTWVSNLQQALPMVVLFVVLLFLPHDRLRGSATRSRERYRVPTVRAAAVCAVLLVVGTWLFAKLLDGTTIGLLQTGLSFAIIALSVTLLTGYAGELNLTPLAFAAVSTLVAFHVGVHGDASRMTLLGLLAGVAAAAVVGALVALPALRLRGLYLALATLAFGVFVSTMLLRDTTEHRIFGHSFTIFPSGNILVPPLKVGRLDLANQTTAVVSLAAVFGLIGLGLVALRNSSYGRRLAAMKDSPAASAMLGQRLLLLKLSVFALSTAIAGLGGVLMAMSTTSVAMGNFDFTVSLSIVMLTVVVGIGYVSGALVAGLIAGAGLNAFVLFLNNQTATHPEYAHVFTVVSHLVLISAALAGVGVARQPSGFLHDLFAQHRQLRRAPAMVIAIGLVQALLYVLALTPVLSTTAFIALSAVLWFAAPGIGRQIFPDRLGTGVRRDPAPELLGVDAEYPPDVAVRLDRELGLPTTLETHHVTA